MAAADINNRFAYHAPPDDDTRKAHEQVRARTGAVARWMDKTLPDGREKSLAITKMEEAMMWANAAIARQSHG